MNAYQNFLDFFSMHNKERLDGLSYSYFAEMTQEERCMAFDFLLKRVEKGGSEESINGIFKADSNRAFEEVKRLMGMRALNGEAKITAAWHLYCMQKDDGLLAVFIDFMASPEERLREKAVYSVPAMLSNELASCLKKMIFTETGYLASIHAVNKLLLCHDVSEESVGKRKYLSIYRGLRSADALAKEAAFKEIDALYE